MLCECPPNFGLWSTNHLGPRLYFGLENESKLIALSAIMLIPDALFFIEFWTALGLRPEFRLCLRDFTSAGSEVSTNFSSLLKGTVLHALFLSEGPPNPVRF